MPPKVCPKCGRKISDDSERAKIYDSEKYNGSEKEK